MALTRARFAGKTHRLISSRWPPIGLFDTVASMEDLEDVILLEGWTNDRITAELGALARLPEEEWVMGAAGAHFVMAAYCHPTPGGGRFNGPDLGAWYCSPELETAFAETVHHHRARLSTAGGLYEARVQMRELVSEIDAEFDELRGVSRPDLYDPADYAVSQRFGEDRRKAGSDGILYDSVRRAGGFCLCVYRPKLLPPVLQADHYEYVWSGGPDPTIVKLTAV